MQFVAIVTVLAHVNVYLTILAIRINRVDQNVYAIQIVRLNKRVLNRNVEIHVLVHAALMLNVVSPIMCRHVCVASVIRVIRTAFVMWSRQHVSNIITAAFMKRNFLICFSSPFFFWFFIAILNSDTPRATYKPLSTLTVWAELTVSRT